MVDTGRHVVRGFRIESGVGLGIGILAGCVGEGGLLAFGLVGTRAPGARFEARVETRADHGPHFSGGGWWGPPEGPLGGGAGAGAPKLLGRPRFLAEDRLKIASRNQDGRDEKNVWELEGYNVRGVSITAKVAEPGKGAPRLPAPRAATTSLSELSTGSLGEQRTRRVARERLGEVKALSSIASKGS